MSLFHTWAAAAWLNFCAFWRFLQFPFQVLLLYFQALCVGLMAEGCQIQRMEGKFHLVSQVTTLWPSSPVEKLNKIASALLTSWPWHHRQCSSAATVLSARPVCCFQHPRGAKSILQKLWEAPGVIQLPLVSSHQYQWRRLFSSLNATFERVTIFLFFALLHC